MTSRTLRIEITGDASRFGRRSLWQRLLTHLLKRS